MKDFVYLDMELLESYMAQKNNGLIKNFQQSKNDEHRKNIGLPQTDIEISATAKVPFLVDGEVKFGLSGAPIVFEDTVTSHKIIDKLQSDNMYDEFYNYIEKENLLDKIDNISKMKQTDSRRYFELEANYNYIDFDRIAILYTEEYRKTYTQYYPEGQESLFNIEKFDRIRNNLDFIRVMIPSGALLCTDELVILVNKECLRGTLELIGYKFGDKATVLGKINKVSEVKEGNPDVIQTLNMIQEYVFILLHDLGFTTKKIQYIATPLAIYL